MMMFSLTTPALTTPAHPYRANTTFVLFTLMLFLLLSGSFAYAKDTPLADYHIDTWTSSDGLPHNSINAIAQTDDGYLWFATWEGVARYNGLSFKLFTRGDATGMQDSGTKSLTALPGNRLLIAGARGSLTERLGFNWQGHASANNLINHALRDQAGNLWLAIEGKGVLLRRLNADGSYDAGDWQLSHSSYRLTEQNGTVYAATVKGLYQLNADTGTARSLPHGAFSKVLYLSRDTDNHLLLATDKGPWRWDGESFSALAPALNDQIISVIEQDRSGHIWLGTINKGVARLKGTTPEFLDTRHGLPNNRVWSWFQDLEGSIWVGTNGGVIRLRKAPFVSVTEQQGLTGNYVRTLLPLPDKGQVLVGTSNGLGLLNHTTPAPALTDAARQHHQSLSVLSLAHRPEGGVWVGSYQQGLLLWQNRQLTQVRNRENGLVSNEIRAILPDSRGNLWLGTPNGLMVRYADGGEQHFTKENSPLPGNFVMALTEDARGRIWIGTGVGVAFLADGQWQNIALPQQENAQYAFGFYSENDYLWMATDRGIVRYRYRDGATHIIGRSNGLPNDKFFQILPDRLGYFWLTSNRGIWRISREEANAVADGRSGQLSFVHFSESDGMATAQANGGSNPTAIRLDNGLLMFATAKGVATLKPDGLNSNHDYRIPVALETLRLNGQVSNPAQHQTLSADIDRIQLSYVGLSYVISDRLQDRTRLQGYDSDWIYRGHSNRAEYTNLPPGHYRFQVSVRYPYGPWHDAGALYEFTVEPSFWQRTDVRLASLMLLITVAAALSQWRTRSLKRSALKLEQKVAEQTHELRQQAQEFERLSREDTLTGLANRRAFDDRLSARFREHQGSGQPLSVAVIDIDHFKRVNDDYSHLVGDQAIKAVAETLKQHFAPNDIARWGGEEFTALFSGDPQQAAAHFDRLRRDLAERHFPQLPQGLQLTISIGIATSTRYQDYDSLLKAADHALLQAKQNGRNRVETET